MSNDEAGRRETFEDAPAKTQRCMLYDAILALKGEMVACRKKNEPRIKKLENQKWVKTAVAGVAGFLGGAAAIFFKGRGE